MTAPRIRPPKGSRLRMSCEAQADFAPIRTYAQVAAEMTRRGHPIPVGSIRYYEQSGFAKIHQALKWIRE